MTRSCTSAGLALGVLVVGTLSVLACADGDDCALTPCPRYVEIFVSALDLPATSGTEFTVETVSGEYSFECDGTDVFATSGTASGRPAGGCSEEPWVVAPVSGQDFLAEEILALRISDAEGAPLAESDATGFGVVEWNPDCGVCVTVSWVASPYEAEPDSGEDELAE